MRYFFHVGQTLMPKNKLEVAAHKMLQDLDHTLISDHALSAFMIKINTGIQALNESYPRCKSIQDLTLWDCPKGVRGVSGLDSVTMYFYPVKNNF